MYRVAVLGDFSQLHQSQFRGAPLEQIHQIDESSPQIHLFCESRFGGAKGLANFLWSGVVFGISGAWGAVPNGPICTHILLLKLSYYL